MATRLQIRRDTAADWTSVDPTLAHGEIGVETDTWKAKIGDGVTAWSGLAYWIGGAGSGDMRAIIYDPTSVVADAFDRANHTGAMPASALDLDGATDIGADLADADLLLIDDGASGANRKSALSRVWTYIKAKIESTLIAFSTYSESTGTLTSVSEALTIPLDGKVHTVTLTEDVTVTFSLPASGRGSCVVNFVQDATGGWVVSFPAATEWADGSATDVDTTASTRTRAVFSQFSATGVDADLEVRGTAS
jgi:hypothetical protein